MAVPASTPEVATDRCPYVREFSPEFKGCPAFTPNEFVAVDTQYKLLAPVTTCRNLVVGQAGAGAFYPRCAIGEPRDRQQYVQQVGADRLAAIKALSLDYRAWVAEQMPAVWERKTELFGARAAQKDDREQKEALLVAIDALVRAAEAWMDERWEPLEQAGLEPALLKQLVREATEEWALRPDSQAAGYQVPDEVLQRFPEPVRVFITAGRTGTS